MESLGKSQIDMDDLRIILTEIDGGRPPLPKDLLWAMAVGDKDHSQKISEGELAFILKIYAKHMEEVSDITALIKKYDKNKDLKLDDDEMEALLKEAVGVPSVSGDDVKRVRVLFDKYSAGHETEGIDPVALAKAISVWDDEANLSEGMFARGSVPIPELKLPDFFGGISNFFNKMCTPVCTTKRPSERKTAARENTKEVLADLCTPQNNISSVHDGPLFELDGSMSDRTFLKRTVIRNHRLGNS
jgi:hypothetical protein